MDSTYISLNETLVIPNDGYSCGCGTNNKDDSDLHFGSVEITTAVEQAKQVKPTTQQQIVEPDIEYTALSHVIIDPVTADIDPNIIAKNIKLGINILGVEGEYAGGGNGIISVNSLGELPNQGVDGMLYVTKDENAVYRWDDNLFRYVAVGRDYEEIELISCGDASTK